MANHRLSDSVTTELHQVAQNLLARRLAQMESGFPLSWEQVQAGVLPEKWRDVVPQMVADGFAIPTDRRPRVKLRHDALTRDAELRVHLRDKPALVPKNYDAIAFDTDVLDEDSMRKLAKWVNTAVEERRLAKLVTRTVREFLRHHADTTGHVQARWPKLVLLADRLTDSAGQYRSRAGEDRRSTWKEKFHEKPRSLLRYRWHTETEMDWWRRHESAMRLSEATLASALLLASEYQEDAPVTAVIGSWTPLPTDPDRNLR
jgi:hypothetical protein